MSAETSQPIEAFTEAEVQRRLEVLFEGGHERCEAGIPDIVSLKYNQIVEIKNARNWREGLGQILSYSGFFPTLTPVLYLFGKKEEMRGITWKIVYETCARAGVTVMRDDVDYPRLMEEASQRQESVDLTKDEQYSRGEITVHEFIERDVIAGEAETTAEIVRERICQSDMKKQQQIIIQQLNKLLGALRQFSPEAMDTRVKIMRIQRDLEATKDQFSIIVSEMNDSIRLAGDCIESEIIFDATATTPLLIYKEVVKRWHASHGNASLISEFRRKLYDLLLKRGVRIERKQKGGSVILGIRMKNDPRKGEAQRSHH